MISYGISITKAHPYQTWREIQSGNYSADMVVLGTSRALEHYDSYVIDSVTGLQFYNLGMGGYGINVELMKYRYYLHYNPQPKYIIYDIDPLPLRIDKAPHQAQSEQFLPLFYDGAIRRDLMNVGYSWVDATVPMARYWGYQIVNKRGILECLNLKHYCDYTSYKGHTPDPDDWNPSRLHFKDSIPLPDDKVAKDMFVDFVQDCQRRGIQLIFVTSPVYHTYVEWTPRWYGEIAWIDSVAQANKILYLNYANHPMCKDSTMFNAGVHMAPEGTKIWSEILSKDLMETIK